MTKQQNDVKTFMQTFGQATPEKPTVPDEKTRILRVKLLLEEVLELAEASGVYIEFDGKNANNKADYDTFVLKGTHCDLVGVADALSDIDYVNQGAAVAYGLNLEPFQDEVHSSNMTKLWLHGELDIAEKNGYSVKQVDAPGDRCYLVKNSDGKVMKSPSYRPADLKRVLTYQFPIESKA